MTGQGRMSGFGPREERRHIIAGKCEEEKRTWDGE